MEKSNKYFYAKGGKQLGPLSLLEIESKIAAGEIRKDTKIWTKGMADWLDADKVEEIQLIFEEFPPETNSDRKSQISLGWRLYSYFGRNYINFCSALLAISTIAMYLQGILMEEYSSLNTFTSLPACVGAGILSVTISTIPAWFAPFNAKAIMRQMRVFVIWLLFVLINQGYEHYVTRENLLLNKDMMEIMLQNPETIQSMSISDVAYVLETNTVQFLNFYTISEIKALTEEQKKRIKETNEW